MTTAAVTLATATGPRWDRLIGILVVVVAVLVIRTVIVHLMGHPDGPPAPPSDRAAAQPGEPVASRRSAAPDRDR